MWWSGDIESSGKKGTLGVLDGLELCGRLALGELLKCKGEWPLVCMLGNKWEVILLLSAFDEGVSEERDTSIVLGCSLGIGMLGVSLSMWWSNVWMLGEEELSLKGKKCS